ncbi:hypothetical protein L7F22_068195 [Adiantum nelumboides]|nr:hypothetical protein [Adiantum nelumboides]
MSRRSSITRSRSQSPAPENPQEVLDNRTTRSTSQAVPSLLLPSLNDSVDQSVSAAGPHASQFSIASYYFDPAQWGTDSHDSSARHTSRYPASLSVRESPPRVRTTQPNTISSSNHPSQNDGNDYDDDAERPFSNWAAGLDYDHAFGLEDEGELITSKGTLETSMLTSTPQQKPAPGSSPLRYGLAGPSRQIFGGRHGRDFSSATEGDVGVHPYIQVDNEDIQESFTNLPLDQEHLGPKPQDSVSFLGATSSRNSSFIQMGTEVPHQSASEVAALTAYKAPSGKVRQTEGYSDERSGERADMEPRRLDQFFGDEEEGMPRRVDSPSSLEEAGDAEMNATRDTHRSSADLYARMGISSRSGEANGVERAKQGLTRVGKSIRRISRRVVNLDGEERPNTEGVIRLPDHQEVDESSSDDEDGMYAVEEVQIVPSKTSSELRGKSLGIFGPENPFRRSLATLMSQWWIEPIILMMIIFNVILLVLQSSRDVFNHPRLPGYFDYWVDYALLAVFVIYTIELVARIVVSGLIINPPAAYEAPQEQRKAEDVVTSPPIETPFSQHLRAKAMRSNTLDTFAAMADTIKVRATEAVRPHNHLGQLNQHGKAPLSPNRAHAPRTVTSDVLDSEPTFPPHQHDQSQSSSATKSQFDRRQPSSATSSSGQWREKTSTFLQKSKLAPFAEAISKQRAQAADYAFLRHSWNRVDLLAVISFWVMFFLAIGGQEMTDNHHIFFFRALSVLRCARLLTVTRGTSVILRSLKTAGPLLVNVSFFTLFSMLLFSIIGVQSFEGNYRRSCLWVGDLQSDPNAPRGQNYTTQQMCGGHRDSVTGAKTRAIGSDGRPLPISIKGFICPVGQLCVESDQNPENNTESFDNIFFALLQVIIVISSNGWSTIMYNMMDADYYASCLYFIIGLIVMNFWMANLFVAVITNTFATISAETKQSAFAAERIEPAKPPSIVEESAAAQRRKRVANVFKRFWGYTKWFWLALIVADLGVQASQASYHETASNRRLSLAELYLTIAFDFEILVRFLSYLLDNDWRAFFTVKRNRFDLFLALITTIIQIPAIKNSDVFPWLTVFQLARFYRVIIAVPRMEALLFRVFGSLSGLFNMIVFLLLMVGLASLLAVQLFRGDIPAESDGQPNEINFKQMWNSFLGMYQIFSSENWTTPLYSALTSEGEFKQAVIAGIFMCGWFLFANFIVLQMFIGVIAENFGIAESQKRAQQLEVYLRNLEKPKTALIVRILQRLSPYRWLREHNAAKMGEKLPEDHPETRLQAERALDKIDEKILNRRSIRNIVSPSKAQGVLKVVRRIARLDRPEEQMPLDTIRARQIRQSFSGTSMLNDRRQMSMYETAAAAGVAATHAAVAASNEPSTFFSASDNMQSDPQDTARLFARDRQLLRMRSDLGLISEERPNQAEVNALHENRWKNDPRIAQARMINTHPSYEKSLWLFSNLNRFRRTCQSIVPCSHGERLFGRRTSPFRLRIYQLAIFATIAASVIIAGWATPAYRRQWYQDHGIRRDSWFSLTEVTLSLIFIAEFFIKVIADGFAFTPNAYLLSPWNALDLFVLLTLLVNVTTELAVIGGVSRFTRALKAFRALRLINLSDLMRRTFSALIAVGGRFIDASVLAILYIVPFAIWGQNLFSGLLYSCTDGSAGIINKASCIGEYGASPSEWTFLAPRSWQNPTEGSVYSFDDFRSSLLILFEIVSLEGWTNVMATAMSVAGFNQQLQTDQRQINALFFVIYNLIGAVFVLTLFVAVIIESFQTFSGAAYLTTAQRQWIDLKRLIARQRPSKRPKIRPTDKVRSWCYDRAVHKHGWWSRSMTVLYLISLITLATEMYNDSKASEQVRDIIYISLASVFAIDIGVRLSGLGWRSYRQDMWNLFDLIVVLGLFTTSIPLLSPNPNNAANAQLQKFFLVAVAFKLVQKNNALNQLFKTAISSLPSIVSLFLLWITFFLVWGIMFVEVFGLTKWNINETYNKNFSTLLGSLVFLAMMSTGEGWNSYMHDFTITEPYCTSSENYLNTDCGSEGWAYFLFIGWNVISMYIFLNMFTATVVENFSYVFQLGGKPTLSREQVRNFKKAWAEFDTTRSGVLRKDQFVPFFNRLDGSLEVRVYPAKATIKALKDKALTSKEGRPRSFDASSRGSRSPTRHNAAAKLLSPLVSSTHKASKEEQREAFLWPPSPNELIVDGLNVTALTRQLGKFDHEEIKRRKMRFERLYHEACLLKDQKENRGKGGLSFTDMLLLLAHYKLIDDEQALSLDELVDRRELMQLVEDRIETERIRGILRQIWLRRRFLAIREAKQRLSSDRSYASLQNIPGSPTTQDIPSINVQDSSLDMNGKQKARQKPALRLDLDSLNDPTSSGRQFVSQFDDDTPSPGKIKTLRQGGLAGEHPSILLTTSGDDDMDDVDSMKQMSVDGLSPKSATPKSYMNELPIGETSMTQLSPSPSLQELERQASPIIQEIDTSAWGSVARRLSADHLSLDRMREDAGNNTGAAASSSSSSSHRQGAFSRMNPFKSRKKSDADQQMPQSSLLREQSREDNSAIHKVQSNTSFGSRDTKDTNEMRESDHSSTASISLRSAKSPNQSQRPAGREGDWI